MKKSFTILLAFISLSGYCQSISFVLDTSQVLQNSDAGNVTSADIDSDGDIDILITGTSSATSANTTLYKNDGMGTFTASSQLVMVKVSDGAAKFADVDNDGDQDLLITGNTSSPIATANLYLNDGTGIFSLSTATPFEPSYGGDIDFGDIDGDGDLDVMITGLNGQDVPFAKLYTNNGSGVFSLVNSTPFISVFLSAVEFIDVDGDNDLDLLVSGEDNAGLGNTSLYLNNGTGIFVTATGTPFTAVYGGDIAFGDTDNDGDQDILISGRNNNNQSVADFYVNNGSTFSLLSSSPFIGTSFHSSALADFNSDGKLDLLHIGLGANSLIGHIYEKTGSNNFILVDSTTIAASYNGMNNIADFNGDGKLDIITTGTSFTAPIWAPKIYFNQSTIFSINENIQEDFTVNIFPNPTSGIINIKTNSNSFSDVEIFDLMGRSIYKERFTDSNISIRLNSPSGVYLLHISNGNFQYSKKVIVQ